MQAALGLNFSKELQLGNCFDDNDNNNNYTFYLTSLSRYPKVLQSKNKNKTLIKRHISDVSSSQNKHTIRVKSH